MFFGGSSCDRRSMAAAFAMSSAAMASTSTIRTNSCSSALAAWMKSSNSARPCITLNMPVSIRVLQLRSDGVGLQRMRPRPLSASNIDPRAAPESGMSCGAYDMGGVRSALGADRGSKATPIHSGGCKAKSAVPHDQSFGDVNGPFPSALAAGVLSATACGAVALCTEPLAVFSRRGVLRRRAGCLRLERGRRSGRIGSLDRSFHRAVRRRPSV